ncbi:MAG TPA: hypothetical protein VIL25_04060 [Vicinamibacterales bacterium]
MQHRAVRTSLPVAFAIAVGAVLSGQQPAPVDDRDQRPLFHAATDAVLVDVVVRDREGRPVTDLTIDGFEIFGTRPDHIRPERAPASTDGPAGADPVGMRP